MSDNSFLCSQLNDLVVASRYVVAKASTLNGNKTLIAASGYADVASSTLSGNKPVFRL
jgi:hypothetical protein